MSTKDHDTDPSTPGAKQRLSEPHVPVAPVSAEDDAVPSAAAEALRQTETQGLRPGTDPGVAPPAQPRAPPAQPMGIVVPPPSAPHGAANDSVDLLLDGIPEDALDRSKNTPQTDGQASAVYHTQHGVRAARTAIVDEPKVVIQRPASVPTVRLQRRKASTAGTQLREESHPGPQDVTVVTGPPMGSRLTMAIAAGLLVVVVIFVLLKSTSEARLAGATTAAAPTAIANAPPAAIPTAKTEARIPTPTAAPVVTLRPIPATATAVPEASPLREAGSASSAPTPPLAKAAPAPERLPKPRPRFVAAPAAAPSTDADLGEFKTSF
ncbi:MAG: hypothetical protein M3O50_13785 [Myxococcota bacterium]|nr:hypothetical protein [Myxococcota bacterium]